MSCLLSHTWPPSAKITPLWQPWGWSRGPSPFPQLVRPSPPGGISESSSFLPSLCPGLEGAGFPRCPRLPIWAFFLPFNFVAKPCCCTRCRTERGTCLARRGWSQVVLQKLLSFTIASCLICFNPKWFFPQPQKTVPFLHWLRIPPATPRAQCQASPHLTWQQLALCLAGTSLSTFYLLLIQTTWVPGSSIPWLCKASVIRYLLPTQSAAIYGKTIHWLSWLNLKSNKAESLLYLPSSEDASQGPGFLLWLPFLLDPGGNVCPGFHSTAVWITLPTDSISRNLCLIG